MSYVWFSLTLRLRKIQNFFTNRYLILASVYNSYHVSVNNDFAIHRHPHRVIARLTSQNVRIPQVTSLSYRLECLIQSWC